MKSSSTKITVIFILIIITLVAIATYFYYDNKKFKIYADCGMEDGPNLGKKISIDIKKIDVEQAFNIDGGKLYVSNTQKYEIDSDTLPPILFKINSNYQVAWAVELRSNNEIEFFAMEDIKLFGHELHFFNSTHLEPGVIYLDENFNFKYMCLSTF
jgi:hypothetical protein